MNDILNKINMVHSSGVPYLSIGEVIYRYREKAKNAPDVTEVYSVSNTYGLIKSEEYWGAQIHSDDTSNYNVVRPRMVAYRPAGIDVGTIGLMPEGEAGLVSPAYVVFGIKDTILPEYLMLNIRSSSVLFQIDQLKEEGARVKFDFDRWDKIRIPVPSLEIQKCIVDVLNHFTSLSDKLDEELSARRKQYEYYSNILFDFDDNIHRKALGEVINVCMCKRIKKDQTSPEGDIPFYKNGTLGKEADSYISQELYDEYRSKYKYPNVGEVMLSTAGTVGRAVKYDGKPAYFQDSNVVWLQNDETEVLNDYLYWFCMSQPWKIPSRSTIKHLHNDMIKDTEIPIPSMEQQRTIIEMLDCFYSLCIDEKKGLLAEISAREKQYRYYRDLLLNIKENAGGVV